MKTGKCKKSENAKNSRKAERKGTESESGAVLLKNSLIEMVRLQPKSVKGV